eukprot:3086252-Amphidinium_carterae.4
MERSTEKGINHTMQFLQLCEGCMRVLEHAKSRPKCVQTMTIIFCNHVRHQAGEATTQGNALFQAKAAVYWRGLESHDLPTLVAAIGPPKRPQSYGRLHLDGIKSLSLKCSRTAAIAQRPVGCVCSGYMATVDGKVRYTDTLC